MSELHARIMTEQDVHDERLWRWVCAPLWIGVVVAPLWSALIVLWAPRRAVAINSGDTIALLMCAAAGYMPFLASAAAARIVWASNRDVSPATARLATAVAITLLGISLKVVSGVTNGSVVGPAWVCAGFAAFVALLLTMVKSSRRMFISFPEPPPENRQLLCSACRYDLSGLNNLTRCPECGAAL